MVVEPDLLGGEIKKGVGKDRSKGWGESVSYRSRASILANFRTISREIINDFPYHRRTATESPRDHWHAVLQYQQRRHTEHINPSRVGRFCRRIPQELPEFRVGQDHLLVFAPRGGRVVCLVYVVGFAILAACASGRIRSR